MNIELFKDLTTEDHIQALEEDAKKYDGLYVEMDNPPERKYVKENAKKINDLIKIIEKARISKAAQHKKDVNSEASAITERLANANKPFTLLIDEYTEQRAKILQDKKDRVKALEDAVKLEGDHEYALLLNEKFDRDAIDQARAAKEAAKEAAENAAMHDLEVAKKAVEQAKQQEIFRQAKIKREQAARIADHEHRRKINRQIINSLKVAGFTEEQCIEVVKVMLSDNCPVTINY